MRYSLSPSNLHIEQIYSHLDPMAIYEGLSLSTDCIFLDSSKKDSPYSNYSIIGVNPFLRVKYDEKTIYIKEYPDKDFSKYDKADIFTFLNQLLEIYALKNPTSLPFIAGGLGYFSYDLCKELEELPNLATEAVKIPDTYFVFYDNYIIVDHELNEVTVTGLGILEDSIQSVGNIRKTIINTKDLELLPLDKGNKSLDFQSSFTKDTYMEAVESMRDYIENGHIYITNMTHTYSGNFTHDPYETYKRLRLINPAPFSAYMPLDGFHVLSSSPERFMDIRDDKVQTRPIKGTIPRGSTPLEDTNNKKILQNSEKDKSELLMIVDLERNDLSKVCIPGSVKVTELFEIEEYATVFHLVSTIEGQLKEEKTAVDCIKSAFPGGSITGAPKVRAMEIIEELEPTKRNIYTGSIGYLGFDGNADFNIVIRTILLKDQKAYIGVGGGITWESNPAMEYQETLDKAKALFKTLNSMN